MQGLEECVAALGHAVWWRERQAGLLEEDVDGWADVDGPPGAGARLDEAAAKTLIEAAPTMQSTRP